MYILLHEYEVHTDIQKIFADKAVAQDFADLKNRPHSRSLYYVAEIELVDGPELHYVAFRGNVFYSSLRQKYYVTRMEEVILRGKLPDIVWNPADAGGKTSCTLHTLTAEEFETQAASICKMLNGLPAWEVTMGDR